MICTVKSSNNNAKNLQYSGVEYDGSMVYNRPASQAKNCKINPYENYGKYILILSIILLVLNSISLHLLIVLFTLESIVCRCPRSPSMRRKMGEASRKVLKVKIYSRLSTKSIASSLHVHTAQGGGGHLGRGVRR